MPADTHRREGCGPNRKMKCQIAPDEPQSVYCLPLTGLLFCTFALRLVTYNIKKLISETVLFFTGKYIGQVTRNMHQNVKFCDAVNKKNTCRLSCKAYATRISGIRGICDRRGSFIQWIHNRSIILYSHMLYR